MTKNQLKEIPQSEWPDLQKLYLNRKTEACSWNLLQNYMDWFATDPNISNVKIFALNGDWSDGTFIVQDGKTFMFNTLNDNQDRLYNALQCIDVIETQSTADYNSLTDFVHRVKPTVDRFMAPLGINVDITLIWYHISRENALSFNLDTPEGFRLAPLSQNNVQLINSLWPYRNPGSEAFISHLIRLNLHVGVFDENGSLLAWCIQMPMGFIGMLQVREDQRRKGLGSLVVRAMSRTLAEREIEVTTSVLDKNLASRSLFENLGFKEIDQIHWVRRPKLK